MKVKAYGILAATTRVRLIDVVEAAIADGWQPLGPCSVDHAQIFQTMVIYEPDENIEVISQLSYDLLDPKECDHPEFKTRRKFNSQYPCTYCRMPYNQFASYDSRLCQHPTRVPHESGKSHSQCISCSTIFGNPCTHLRIAVDTNECLSCGDIVDHRCVAVPIDETRNNQ